MPRVSIQKRIDQIQKDAKEHAENDLKFFKEFTDSIKELRAELKEFREEQNEKWIEMTPVKEAFNDVKFSGWIIAKTVGFIGTVVGILYGIKQVFFRK